MVDNETNAYLILEEHVGTVFFFARISRFRLFDIPALYDRFLLLLSFIVTEIYRFVQNSKTVHKKGFFCIG